MEEEAEANVENNDEDNIETRHVTVTNLPLYKLVGDNIDKVVKPHHMRIDHQAKSLHYFHSYAVKDWINFFHHSDQPALLNLDDVNVATLLPTTQEETVKSNFAILVARVLKHMPFFAQFGSSLKQHISYLHTKKISAKSEVVSICTALV